MSKIKIVAENHNKTWAILKKDDVYAKVELSKGLEDDQQWYSSKLLSSALMKGGYTHTDKEYTQKGRKSVQSMSSDGKTDKEEDETKKNLKKLGLEHFVDDLLHRKVKKSLSNPDGCPYVQEYLDMEKSILEEMNLVKAGKVHLPKGSERYSYKTHSDYGVIHIPVNRLEQVYQSDKAINKKKVNENKIKMKRGTPLHPVEIGYNYDVHDGHHRWHAAMELGHTHVPCKVVGQDPDKVAEAKKKYREVWKSEQEMEALHQEKIFRDFMGDNLQLSLVLDLSKGMLHKGKLIKRRITVKGKNGKMYYRMQWIDPTKENPKMHSKVKGEEDHSSYKHDKKVVSEIERRQSNRFPVVHHPVKETKNRLHNYRSDKSAVRKAKESYHKGESLPPVKLNEKGEIIDGHHLLDMAKELGLSHVPSIVLGSPKLKKEYEDKYKDDVLVPEKDEEGNEHLVPASVAGMGVSADGTNRGQHMRHEVPVEYQDNQLHFQKFIIPMYTRKHIIQEAERLGIRWDETGKNGEPITDERVLWTRIHGAISDYIAAGNKFTVKHDQKDNDRKMEQTNKDSVHPYFLRFCDKFGFDQDKIMDWCRKNDIKWKEKSDPLANWMYAATEIKKQLASGKMLNGVRTRQKGAMKTANMVISDAIKERVRSLSKKYGKARLEEAARENGIELDLVNKQGKEIPPESPIRWMRVSTAIQTHIAQGNHFNVSGDDYGDGGKITAEYGNYGGVTINREYLKAAIDTAKHNSKKFEKQARDWAYKAIAIDNGWAKVDVKEGKAIDEYGRTKKTKSVTIDPDRMQDVKDMYDALIEGASNSKLMYHFDPTEELDSGVSILEQMLSDGTLKPNQELGRGDKDAQDVVDRDVFGDEIDDAEDHERPIYGTIDLFNQGLEIGGHGSVAFVFKDDVKQRSGATPMDSNSIPYGEEGKMVYSAQNPHHLLVRRWTDRWRSPNNKDGQRKRAVESIITGNTHRDDKNPFESQIVGGVDLRRDVDHILIPESWKTDKDFQDHHDLMHMFAENIGVPVKYQ